MSDHCCPHCGGKQGIERISRWERYEGSVSWGDAVENDVFEATGEVRGGKMGYCVDCGKRVRAHFHEVTGRKIRGGER